MTLGEKIRKLRIAARLKQKELAALIGVDPATISAWETGIAYPHNTPILMIAKAFGMSEEELCSGAILPKEKPKTSHSIIDPEMVSLEEAKEIYDKRPRSEKRSLIAQYELLGMTVIRDQANEYKSVLTALKKAVSVDDRNRLYYRKLAIERWFDSCMHTFIITELTGAEMCEKIRKTLD